MGFSGVPLGAPRASNRARPACVPEISPNRKASPFAPSRVKCLGSRCCLMLVPRVKNDEYHGPRYYKLISVIIIRRMYLPGNLRSSPALLSAPSSGEPCTSGVRVALLGFSLLPGGHRCCSRKFRTQRRLLYLQLHLYLYI